MKEYVEFGGFYWDKENIEVGFRGMILKSVGEIGGGKIIQKGGNIFNNGLGYIDF